MNIVTAWIGLVLPLKVIINHCIEIVFQMNRLTLIRITDVFNIFYEPFSPFTGRKLAGM